MKRFTLAVCSVAILVGLVSASASGSPPRPVSISIAIVFPPDGAPFGPFTASGPICPSGDTIDIYNKAAGGRSGSRLQLLVIKEFTCADGSGTFLMLLQVHLRFVPFSDEATWTVIGGTGDYERLRGNGRLTAVTGGIETFTGRMHFD